MTARRKAARRPEAVADYANPMVFDPVMATVNVCVRQWARDEILVNHLTRTWRRVDRYPSSRLRPRSSGRHPVLGAIAAVWPYLKAADDAGRRLQRVAFS